MGGQQIFHDPYPQRETESLKPGTFSFPPNSHGMPQESNLPCVQTSSERQREEIPAPDNGNRNRAMRQMGNLLLLQAGRAISQTILGSCPRPKYQEGFICVCVSQGNPSFPSNMVCTIFLNDPRAGENSALLSFMAWLEFPHPVLTPASQGSVLRLPSSL